jgi:glutamate-1-semialdehyde 2,1-aminomutase
MAGRDGLRAELEQAYRGTTPASGALYERAQQVLPGGDTRQSVFFRPYPLFLDGGQGAYVEDVDGNRYLDCCNCWTAVILGHAHPSVVEAASNQLVKGTAFNAANEHAVELAELIVERVPSVEQVRFTNSGTEATMMAVRAARAFTGRSKLVKMRGAYHGSHDDFTIAYGEAPSGIIPNAAMHVLEVEFNDPDDITRVMTEHGNEVAAVIVEGVLGSAGMIPPEGSYLQHLRSETERHGALLVMDEVISLRVAYGGAQDLYGVTPDLTAMGKIIGGGFSVGAFGGRREIMQQYSPLGERPLTHSGTFNANPIAMAAGVAAMQELDADAIGYLNQLGNRFATGVRRIAAEQGIPLQVTGAGSLVNLHFAERAPRNASEAAATDKESLRLLHLAMLLDGVLIAPRGMVTFSVVTTEGEVDRVIQTLDGAMRRLQPVIRTASPAPSE